MKRFLTGSLLAYVATFVEVDVARAAAKCVVESANTCGVAAYCEAQEDGSGLCARVTPAPFALFLPIPKGEAIFCAKGTRVPKSSHSSLHDNTRFAVDLASPAFDAPKLILAPRDGVVAHARGGCTSVDLSFQKSEDGCNDGWGNYIRIQHEDQWFTQLAHLSAILVNEGQTVRAGDVIGIEGNTGKAGAKHLHLSLHRGNPLTGTGPSYPMRLITQAGELDDGAFACGNWLLTTNVDAHSQHVSVLVARKPAHQTFGFRSNAYDVAQEQGTPPAHAVPHLSGNALERGIAQLQRSRDPVERYYLGWALVSAGRAQQAEGIFDALLNVSEPRWVAPWSKMRLAFLQVERGEYALAKVILAEPPQTGESFSEWSSFMVRLRAKLPR